MNAFLEALFVGMVCSLLFLAFSFALNRGLRRSRFTVNLSHIGLYAAAVFLVAIVSEILINSTYESHFGRKLWDYRVLPLYDGDISLLAFFIWPVYGVHLYFFRQVLSDRLPDRYDNDLVHAAIIGLDAPLFYEVSGNLLFILILGDYYAYYLPGELFHLTSIQVIPIYMVFLFAGLKILAWLMAARLRYKTPLLYLLGLAVVFSAYAFR